MEFQHISVNRVAALSKRVVVLPVGSVEQHGAHLPVTTDFLIAQAWGRALAEKLGCFCLPALPVSTCFEHKGRPGHALFSPETFMAMMRDIVEDLEEQGYERVVILQAHGGIFAMTPVVRAINARDGRAKVILLDGMSVVPREDSRQVFETEDNIHACEHETSLMLYLHPEYVDMSLAVDEVPPVPRPYLNYGSLPSLSASGVWGYPTKATAQKGGALFRLLVEGSVKAVERIDEILSRPYGRPLKPL